MRFYSSIAGPGALDASIDSSATSIQVAGAVGWPSSKPHTAVIDPDTTLEEIVTVTAAVGNTWTVTRGQDGTAAVPHAAGAVVKHMATARDYREPQEHIDASTNVHGVTSGNPVGTSQAQTLTNKTISGSSNTLTNIAQSSVTGLSTHTGSSSGVHGLTSGSVVGTSQTQTLTNKTIGSSNTITGQDYTAINGLTAEIAKLGNISNIACGVATFTTNSSGHANLLHNSGFTPTVMFFQHLGSATSARFVMHREGSTLGSTTVGVGMYSGANGLVIPDTASGDVFWVAIRSA